LFLFWLNSNLESDASALKERSNNCADGEGHKEGCGGSANDEVDGVADVKLCEGLEHKELMILILT
jgi:hypothetical protein